MGAEGQRMLSWFIGSGRVCRSYLFERDGFLFQAPMAYYSELRKWDLSPGYQRKRTIELTRGVETGCLQCHTSRMQAVAGMPSRFAAVPFLEGGVSCERCHGGGRAHFLRMSAKTRPANPPVSVDRSARLFLDKKWVVFAPFGLLVPGAARVEGRRPRCVGRE